MKPIRVLLQAIKGETCKNCGKNFRTTLKKLIESQMCHDCYLKDFEEMIANL